MLPSRTHWSIWIIENIWIYKYIVYCIRTLNHMRIESKTRTSSRNKSIAPHIFQSLIHFFGLFFWRNFVFCSLSSFIRSNVMSTWKSFSRQSKKKFELWTVFHEAHTCVFAGPYMQVLVNIEYGTGWADKKSKEIFEFRMSSLLY